MKNSQKKRKTSAAVSTGNQKINLQIKEISFDENSPALLKKKREAQALLQSNKAQAH